MIDMSIRLGMDTYPGLHVVKVFDDEVSSVCSSKLLAGPVPLDCLYDVKLHRLLHVDWAASTSQSPNGHMLAQVAGLEDLAVDRGPRFTV